MFLDTVKLRLSETKLIQTLSRVRMAYTLLGFILRPGDLTVICSDLLG